MEVQEIIANKKNLINFLKEKGLQEETEYSDDEFKEGTYFKISKRKLLVVYEIFDEEKLKPIKDHFLIDRGLSYAILIFNQKIIFFRNFGETKHFIYSERTKNNPSKIDKLENIEKNIDEIFQSKDISAQFYESFKTKRNLLVQNIKNDVAPTEKYLIAQKIFDRFFFIYFLCHKGIIKFKDGRKISGETIFSHILLKKGEFLENLKKLFHLFNSQEKDILAIGDYEIVIPYLNGGLFRPDVLEQDLNISLKVLQWEQIFDFLNSYHWIIEEVKATEENEERILTPEILGHVYERSVVEWEQKGFGEEVKEAVKKVTERKKKGVYYTPESITNYISNNTINPYLVDKLKNKYSSFEELIESNNKKDMKDALKILDEIKILDPACGSGAFLIKASEVIFSLKRRLNYELKEQKNFYDLKLDIITENIYGVDILAGAVEISKLRLWLWLISDYEEAKNKINALPNIEYNLKVGNSLIGWLDEKLEQTAIIPLSEKIDGIFIGLIALSDGEELEELKKSRSILAGHNLNEYIQAYYLVYKIYRRAHGLKAEQIRSILETVRQAIYSTVTPAFLAYVNKKIKPNHNNKKPPIPKEEFEKLQVFHWRIDFGDIILNGGFDIVIGNPPYGQNKIGKVEEKYLSKNLKSTGSKNDGGTKNPAPIFVEKAYYLIRNEGILGFIINNSVCRVDEFRNFRKFLLDKTYLYEIVDEGNPFSDVTLEMICLFYRKKEKKDYKIRIKSNRYPGHTNLIDKSKFAEYDRFILYLDDFFEKISKISKTNVISGKRGGDIQFSKKKNKEFCVPYLFSGKSVKKYYLDKKYFYWVSKNKKLSNSFTTEKENEILVTTKISNVYRCMLKPKNYLVGNNVIKIYSDYDNKLLCSILNSKLMDYVVKRYLVNYSELTIAFYDSLLKPTPLIMPKKQKPFITLVNKILEITKDSDYLENNGKQEKVKEIQKEIDNLVYKLYDLTSEEIKIVEGE